MFKSLVSAFRHLVASSSSSTTTDADGHKQRGHGEMPPLKEKPNTDDPSPSAPEEMAFDDGVGDFLDNVIAGKTDKLRKEIAEQKLLSAAEEATHSPHASHGSNNKASMTMANSSGHAESLSGQGALTRSTTGPHVGAIVSANPSALTNGSAGTASESYASQRSTAYMSSAARSLQNYELIAYLGSGTFAEVTLARHRVTKELYAIKKISKQRVREEGCVERTFTERQLLANLRHPFLVQLYQAFQSRLYLYLVIDFAQGGDLFYFTEKTLWVKEMKRSLRKFKYPYYTNGGHAHRRSSSQTTLTLPSGDGLESGISVRRGHHHHHASPLGRNLALGDDAGLTASKPLRSHRRSFRTSKSTNDLADDAVIDVARSRHCPHARRSVSSHHSFDDVNDQKSHDHSSATPPSKARAYEDGEDDDAAALSTPPTQALRLHTGSSSTGESRQHAARSGTQPPAPTAARATMASAHDTDDADGGCGGVEKRSVDLFSTEAVEALRQQLRDKQEQQRQQPLLHQIGLDGGNGTDTDVNVDAMHFALAGAGASASTLNAVRAGEYYTTDAIDEFADHKEMFSDAGGGGGKPALSPPSSSLASLAFASAGGEVANKTEDVYAVAGAAGASLWADTASLAASASADDASTTASRRQSTEQRRRDIERSRDAVAKDNDEDDENENEAAHDAAHRRLRGASHPMLHPRDEPQISGTRLPPALRKVSSRGSSVSALAAASSATEGYYNTTEHPLSLAATSSGIKASTNASASSHSANRRSGHSLKRAAHSAVDMTSAAYLDDGEVSVSRQEKSGKSGAHGVRQEKSSHHRPRVVVDGGSALTREETLTPRARTRHRSGRSGTGHSSSRGAGGGVVQEHADALDETSDGANRTFSHTVSSELHLAHTASGGCGGDSPLPHITASALHSGGGRRSRHTSQSHMPHPPSSSSVSRSARRSRSEGASGATTPCSVSGSRHTGRAHTHAHRSTARSLLGTPPRATTTPTPTAPQKVDLNAPFHEVRTAGSRVPMPACAEDESRLPLRLIAFYAVEVGLVLQYLHNCGFIYRDLKPENILMRRDGHIMLTDFGVAKYRKGAAIGTTSTDPLNSTVPSDNNAASTSNAGRATSFTGTAQYMSPEMVQGLPHDTRTDWWSFGCLLFEWCNGRKAYDEPNQFALFRSIVEEDVKVKEGDFQLTRLELHSRAAQLHCHHQEFILTCLHAKFVSLPQASQSNVVAALTDASFSHLNRTTVSADIDGTPITQPPPSVTDTLERPDGTTPGSLASARPVTDGHTSSTRTGVGHSNNNNNGNDSGNTAKAEKSTTADGVSSLAPQPAMLAPHEPRSPPPASSLNPSLSQLPKDFLRSLAGTPANLSFQFAPDGSIAATVGTTNPFAGITGEHMDLATYELFMEWTIAQETEALHLLEDLIRRLLNRNVQERLSGVDVLEHPFFTCSYITSQLYYQQYVREHYETLWNRDTEEGGVATEAEAGPTADDAVKSAKGEGADDTKEGHATTASPSSPERSFLAHNAAGEPELSPQHFLHMSPLVRRPDAWVDLFEERRIPPVYVPRLRTQDDLRYFPSAVTAMGLSAAAEQQKRIKEAKEQKREFLRHAVEQAAQQSGAVMTEDEHGMYLSLLTPQSDTHSSRGELGQSHLSSATSGDYRGNVDRHSGHGGSLPLGSPADPLRRVSSSLTSAVIAQSNLSANASTAQPDAVAPPASSEVSTTPTTATTTTTSSAWVDDAAHRREDETTSASAPVSTSHATIAHLTDHLASLLAGLPSGDEGDDSAAEPGPVVSQRPSAVEAAAVARSPEPSAPDPTANAGKDTNDRPHSGSGHSDADRPRQAPYSYRPPSALRAGATDSPSVVRNDISSDPFVPRTSTSTAGDEPIALGATQPMIDANLMLPPTPSPSLEAGRASQPLSPPTARSSDDDLFVKRSGAEAVEVPSLVASSAIAAPRQPFMLTLPLTISSHHDDAAWGEHGTNSTNHSGTHTVSPLSCTGVPLLSPQGHESFQSANKPGVAPSERAAAAASLASAAATGKPSAENDVPDHHARRPSELDEDHVTAASTHSHSVVVGEWSSGRSTSTTAQESSTDVVTPQGEHTGRGRDDDEDDEDDDLMARTAVLPADFVKAALALAAAQQKQQQRHELTSFPPSGDDASRAARVQPASGPDVSPSTSSLQPAISPTGHAAVGSEAHDAETVSVASSRMAPSAVTVAYPNVLNDLTEGPTSPLGARDGADAQPPALPGTTPGSPHVTNETISFLAPANTSATARPTTADPSAEDSALYLGVDATGGYYETDALEEGDGSAAEPPGDGVDSENLAHTATEAEPQQATSSGSTTASLPAVMTNQEPTASQSRPSTVACHSKQSSAFFTATSAPSASAPSSMVAVPVDALANASGSTAALLHDPPLTDMLEGLRSSSDPATLAFTTSYTDVDAESRGSLAFGLSEIVEVGPETHTFGALRGEGPLFNSSECSILSAHAVGVVGPLAEIFTQESAVDSASDGEEARMKSRTIVPVMEVIAQSWTKGMPVSSSTGPVSHKDDAADEADDAAVKRTGSDEEDELSALVDPSGYEEDEESGQSADDEEEDDNREESFEEEDAASGSADDEYAYSDEDASDAGSGSYTGSSYTYGSSRTSGDDGAMLECDGTGQAGTTARNTRNHSASATSTTSTSSSANEGGFRTDQSLSFSFSRATVNNSESPTSAHRMGVSVVTGFPGTANTSLTGSIMVRYPNMLGLSTSFNPWASGSYRSALGSSMTSGVPIGGGSGSMALPSSASPPNAIGGAETPMNCSTRRAARTTSPSGRDATVQSLALSSSDSLGRQRGATSYGNAQSFSRDVTTSARSFGPGGGSGAADGPQPWWSRARSPPITGQLTNSFSASGAATAQSPAASNGHAFPDLTLNALYAPVNTLSGVSYDVEDDVHSPAATGRHGEGGAGGARHARGPTGYRRGTQSMVDSRATQRARASQGNASSGTAATGTRTSAFTTTNTRAGPASLATASADVQSDTASLTSSDTFMGFTFNDPQGHGAGGRGPALGGYAHRAAVRRPTAAPAASPTSIFTVGVTTRSPTVSGDVSDEQDGSSLNAANHPDHFANFSFFSTPSDLLPRGYGSGNGF